MKTSRTEHLKPNMSAGHILKSVSGPHPSPARSMSLGQWKIFFFIKYTNFYRKHRPTKSCIPVFLLCSNCLSPALIQLCAGFKGVRAAVSSSCQIGSPIGLVEKAGGTCDIGMQGWSVEGTSSFYIVLVGGFNHILFSIIYIYIYGIILPID